MPRRFNPDAEFTTFGAIASDLGLAYSTVVHGAEHACLRGGDALDIIRCGKSILVPVVQYQYHKNMFYRGGCNGACLRIREKREAEAAEENAAINRAFLKAAS